MLIGFDAKRITHNSTGLGNYGRFIVDALADNFKDNNYLLYSINSGRESLYTQLEKHSCLQFRYPGAKWKFTPSIWRSHGIIKDISRDKIDIFHGLSNELPAGIKRSRIPGIVTVHDLIYLRYPKTYNIVDRNLYALKYKKSCQEATQIIAVSQKTKEDLINYWGISEEKITVIYQGCNPIFLNEATEEMKQHIRRKYNISAPYILYVGTIEERKNLLTLVKAYNILKNVDIDLIVLGRPTPYYKQVEKFICENSLQSRVKIHFSAKTDELPALYQMAEIFVYPSRYEGFGIPVLEALVSNTPVIAATGSCLEETGGGASLYFDPDNVFQLSAHIQAVLNDRSLSDRMKREGRIHAEKFTPSQISQQLIDLYANYI
jgi:glycosyltransferase involved in cell wall biosynthesis